METDKDLKNLVGKIMEEIPLEAPSSNFTHSVMQEVAKLEQSKVAYKPILSLRAVGIAVAMLSVFGLYLFTINSETSTSGGQYVLLLTDTKSWFSERLPQLQFSKTFSYMVGAIGLMVCFQALILKRYFSNRLA